MLPPARNLPLPSDHGDIPTTLSLLTQLAPSIDTVAVFVRAYPHTLRDLFRHLRSTLPTKTQKPRRSPDWSLLLAFPPERPSVTIAYKRDYMRCPYKASSKFTIQAPSVPDILWLDQWLNRLAFAFGLEVGLSSVDFAIDFIVRQHKSFENRLQVYYLLLGTLWVPRVRKVDLRYATTAYVGDTRFDGKAVRIYLRPKLDGASRRGYVEAPRVRLEFCAKRRKLLRMGVPDLDALSRFSFVKLLAEFSFVDFRMDSFEAALARVLRSQCSRALGIFYDRLQDELVAPGVNFLMDYVTACRRLLGRRCPPVRKSWRRPANALHHHVLEALKRRDRRVLK